MHQGNVCLLDTWDWRSARSALLNSR